MKWIKFARSQGHKMRPKQRSPLECQSKGSTGKQFVPVYLNAFMPLEQAVRGPLKEGKHLTTSESDYLLSSSADGFII